jgi:hypothetical protein
MSEKAREAPRRPEKAREGQTRLDQPPHALTSAQTSKTEKDIP